MATVYYQTLSEFLREPFGQSDDRDKLSKYNSMYNASTSKIKLNAYTKIEDAYYFHIKIPSESQKEQNIYYDVVVRFFTDKPDALRSSHLRDYYIQFFSNSPGFIYNYAVVYRMRGFLIDSLYKKMDPDYFDKLPEKTNKDLKLSYDKSIYFACRFLSEKRFRVLNKVGIPLGRKLPPNQFFREIKDFETVKIEGELVSIEKKALKDLDRTLRANKQLERSSKKRELDTHRKSATTSTMKQKRSIYGTKKIASKSTTKTPTIKRKSATKSTRRK